MITWVDIETTGLEAKKDHLLEVALVITDDDLNERAAMSVVTKPVGVDIDAVDMPQVVRDMHTKNGLLEAVRTYGVRRHEAEEALLKFCTAFFDPSNVPLVKTHVCVWCEKNENTHVMDSGHLRCGSLEKPFMARQENAIHHTQLAGSTVSFDKGFLREHMASLVKPFHYRVIDVSSINEMARRWIPDIYALRPKSEDAHRALPDVRGSIAMLRFYRDVGFMNATSEMNRAVSALKMLGMKVSR